MAVPETIDDFTLSGVEAVLAEVLPEGGFVAQGGGAFDRSIGESGDWGIPRRRARED